MYEEQLRPGDLVTVRKGAPMPHDAKRRLKQDCRAKVIEITGKRVKVHAEDPFVDAEDGSRVMAPFVYFDLSYVYKRDV